MIRQFVAFLGISLSVPGLVHAKDANIIALIVAVGEGRAQADAAQATLRRLGAVTLRTDDPTNASLRVEAKRFATEAAAADVAIAVIAGPVVTLADRDFVAPGDLVLRRPNDLLTRAVPLSAFARAADLAGEGGAVLVLPHPSASALPDGVQPIDGAPEALPGMSPVLVAGGGSAGGVLVTLDLASGDETVELAAILREMQGIAGTAISFIPEREVLLRMPDPAPVVEAAPPSPSPSPVPAPVAAVTPEPVLATAEPGLAPAEPGVAPPAAARLSPEMLATLERGLSRAERRAIQRALNLRGHYAGPIDGVIGDQTRAAIRAFQAIAGGETTGFLTPEQLGVLR